jgi:hypothetical protein
MQAKQKGCKDIKDNIKVLLFAAWILVPLLLSICGLIAGFKIAGNLKAEFPLLETIVVSFTYVPALFIVAWLVVFALVKFMTDKRLKRTISTLFMTIVYIYSLTAYRFFDLAQWIVISLFYLALGFAYYSVTDLIYNNLGMEDVRLKYVRGSEDLYT